MAASFVAEQDGHRLVPLTDELQFNQEKLVYAVISPEELAAELDEPDVDLADLVERYKPEEKKQQSVWDTRERGTADEARAWIAAGELDDELAESLSALVGRFEEATFVRESDELLAYFASARGPAHYAVTRMTIELPGWLKTWRKTLAWADIDEKPTCFVVERAELPAELGHEGALAFTLRPMGRKNSDFAQALINRHRAYPIGYGGEEAELALAVDLRQQADPSIFIFRTEQVYRWNFDPFAHRLFDGPAAMFEAVDRLATSGTCGDCPAEMLGNRPPTVEFDLDAHLERGGADQAHGWMEQASLSSRLKEALASFVDGFAELTFVRDSEASLQYYEVINKARLPAWYRQLRKTLAFAEADGRGVGLIFGSWENMADEPFEWGPNHVIVDMGHKLISDYEHYAVLNSPNNVVTTRLESDDSTLYWSDVDDVDLGGFSPIPKFSSFADALDAVTAVRAGGNTLERR